LGFNVKVLDGNLFGVKQIRFRAEIVDPSFIRDKLMYDIANALDIPCLSLNFARLYFNDRFMGFYAMRDTYKSSWIRSYFGEKDTTHLYECDSSFGYTGSFSCRNDDEKLRDSDVDFDKFIDRINNAKSKAELAEFFDVETYLKWQAIKYLIGGWDHKTVGQNQYLYMFRNPVTGKDMWIPLVYDFDNDFGAYDKTDPNQTFKEDIYKYEKDNPIYTVLGIKDANADIIKYLSEFMRRYFNPQKLFQRIDKIKNFVDPYMREDRIPDAQGNRPGRVPRVYYRAKDQFTYEDFVGNVEYTNIIVRKFIGNGQIDETKVYGLKQWVFERFKFICEHYDIDCSYANDFMKTVKYTTDVVVREERNNGCKDSDYECCILPVSEVETVDNVGKWRHEMGHWCLIESEGEEDECWSLSEGYPCCTDEKTTVDYVTERRAAKYGFENNEWCGITDLQLNYIYNNCFSIAEGYPCCKKDDTEIYYISKSKGQPWGLENGEWCGITDIQLNYMETHKE